ncbi:peptide-methionine (R)-S-oxide reductase [Fulvitalea axinellae]|uniref:peptide-methionine (R)-S-oxide reductase n=1 Tax=Fulvitalea axinellae TaxID=1182444 RepID=A0AAU9CA57_9BACT|nr:peptide-methionine (R)-S-oxide reductase [Fulvitalea axinellae]
MRWIAFYSMILLAITNNLGFAQKQKEEMKDGKKYKIEKSEKEWREVLDGNAFRVLREKGTERAFTGKYDHFFEKGDYYCKGCGNRLFSSDTKYNSGCGWPAFYDVQKEAIEYKSDNSYGMKRVEVLCADCGGHLGHVFNDGPKDKTGIRFCINSAALEFRKKEGKEDKKKKDD